ncbi:MAG: UDP-N-acetylmuramate dehydrogenase [Alphaproteobacteria bacterium]
MIDRLPPVKGDIKVLELSKLTWFRVGGKATVFTPVDEDDLQNFLQNKPNDIEIYPLGLGSNVLIRDGGFNGVIIRTNKLSELSINGTEITTGTGNADLKVSKFALANSITGFEFLSGIPGAIGGALAMNAGAYENDINNIFVSAEGFDYNGNKVSLSKDDMNFSYRHCDMAGKIIFTKATFKGEIGNENEISNKMEQINKSRNDSQPVKSRTGGSTFRNPDDNKAWELIDRVGLRGKVIGGAMISDKHCNFLINNGDATANDLESLGDLAKDTVKSETGIDLHWEIKRIGEYE